MKKRFVDTNVFLRFLTRDNPEKFEDCKSLFKKTIKGKISLITSEMVIAELIWTLLSYYNVPKAEVVEKVSIILNTPNLHVLNKDLILEALVLYGKKDIDYIDAYNTVFMGHHKVEEIYTYDQHFSIIDNIHPMKP